MTIPNTALHKDFDIFNHSLHCDLCTVKEKNNNHILHLRALKCNAMDRPLNSVMSAVEAYGRKHYYIKSAEKSNQPVHRHPTQICWCTKQRYSRA